jgi:outer membrane protein
MEAKMTILRTTAKNGKLFVLAAAVMAVLLALSAQSARAEEQIKIGYLDLDRIVQAVAKQTPEYDKLSEEWDKKNAEMERLRAEINDLAEELEKNKVIWPENKSLEHQQLIQDKADELKSFRADAQRFKEREENKVLRRLLPEIVKTVKKVGERDGYSMIFEKRMLLYPSPNFNLTETIIKEMTENGIE